MNVVIGILRPAKVVAVLASIVGTPQCYAQPEKKESVELRRNANGRKHKPSRSNLQLLRKLITYLGLLAAIVAAIGSMWQAKVTQQALDLTQEQLRENKREFEIQLRRSDKESAEQGRVTAEQLRLTQQLIQANQANANAANKAVAVASNSGDVAKQQLELSQRPWVTVIPEVAMLTFGELGVVIELKLALKNIGHSPATHVLAAVNTMLMGNMDKAGTDIENARKNICGNGPGTVATKESAKLLARLQYMPPNEAAGQTIFPGDESFLTLTTATGRNAVQEYIYSANEELQKLGPGYGQVATIFPAVIGCVDYDFDLGRTHHQTDFAYEIEAKDSRGIWMPPKPTPVSSNLLLAPLLTENAFVAY